MAVNKRNIFLILILVIILFFLSVFFIKKSSTKTEDETVNIVFTTDMKYKEYLKVAMKSAIMNKNKDSLYNIIILAVDLPQSECQKFSEFADNNVKINIIPLKIDSISKIGDFEVSNYVSRADLFKFFMPDILKDYNKILYIDDDTLILKDLSELYNTDIRNYYLAASYKYVPSSYWKRFLWMYYRHPEYEYNCGVMLMNLDKMRKDDIKSKLIEAKNRDIERVLMTQSAFNKVIKTKEIKKISPIYNYYARLGIKKIVFADLKEAYKPFLDDINSLSELHDKAVIVHFAGKIKPWFDTNIDYSSEWWKYAKMINKNWQKEEIPQEYKKIAPLF